MMDLFLLFIWSSIVTHANTYSTSYHNGYRYGGTYNADEIHSNLRKISQMKLQMRQNLNKTQARLSNLQSNLTANITQSYENITSYVRNIYVILNSELTTMKSRIVPNLPTKLQELEIRLHKMETRIKVEHSFCQSLPASTCGPCLCFDDYKLSTKYYCDCQNLQVKRDCLEYYNSGVKVNGVYKVHNNNLKMMRVYCDQTTDGGGWTVFQRRYDGSTDFYRNWEMYESGFGTLQHEFWLGMADIHVLTMQSMVPKGTELRIDMKKVDTSQVYFAKYRHFQVANSFLKYMLHVYGYTGTSGDSLSSQNGRYFSTYDRDNDGDNDTHCSRLHHGGWWYSSCGKSNLNGLLDKSFNVNETRSMFWESLIGTNLRFAEMKARRAI